jgi:hypothetical protein
MNETLPALTGAGALDALRAELLPIVIEARRTAPRPEWATVRVRLSPLGVSVVLHDEGDGEVGQFVAEGTPALAEAAAAALNGCLAALPADRAQKVRAFAAREPGALWLLADDHVTHVHAVLDPGGDAEAIVLGTLAVPEVRH